LLTKVADIGFDEELDPLQKEFLEDALTYYEQFTSRVVQDPSVRLEHGRVHQQMGDIQRKLGRLAESKRSYLKAIDVLEPLANHTSVGADSKRTLARTRTLLADVLVRSGSDKYQAEPLYSQALEVQQALASAPVVTDMDHLHLGQTLKSQADLLRLNGQFGQAGSVYEKALAVLEKAHAATPNQSEIRNELAMAIDARGWIHRELGNVKQAELNYRRALKLLEQLVKEFPTVPRHRESLARAYNSLGLIEESDGRLADAETHLRGELPLVERLSQDFPARPEHQRELARTLMNLGNVLSAQNRPEDAEPFLHRAIDVNTVINAKEPADVQVKLDLAKCHHNLGDLLRKRGEPNQAVASLLQARSIDEALVKASPEKPRYSDLLATTLTNLALALQVVDPSKVEETNRTALSIYEKLVALYPDNVDYRLGRARCLQNQGTVVAATGKTEQAEATYKEALATLETKRTNHPLPEWLRVQAGVLNNLGELHRPGAEDAYRRSIALSTALADHKPSARADRHNLAIAQSNLGQFLLEQKRSPEAGSLLAQSVVNLEKLVSDFPKAIDLQSHLGIVLAAQATWLDSRGKPAEAKAALGKAIEHQRQAVQLSKNGPGYRDQLGHHLQDLAQLNLKMGVYEEAVRLALDLPRTVPSSSRAQACLDAARILARLVAQVGGNAKLAQADRDRLVRNYLGRTIVLLREAIDTNPKLAEEVKTDAEINRLESHPEFQTIMNTLVNLGR